MEYTMNKRAVTIEIMNHNVDKSMEDVCHLIAEYADMSYVMARSYYRWAVNEGYANGHIEQGKRGPKIGTKFLKKEEVKVLQENVEDNISHEDHCKAEEVYQDHSEIEHAEQHA